MTVLLVCWRMIEIILCSFVSVSFIPKVWNKTRRYADRYLSENTNCKDNAGLCCYTRTRINSYDEVRQEIPMVARQKRKNQLSPTIQNNVIDISANSLEVELRGKGLSDSNRNQISASNFDKGIVNQTNNEPESKEYQYCISAKENDEKLLNVPRKGSLVSEIAKKFENNGKKVRGVHMASKDHQHISGNYFEETTNKHTNGDCNQKSQKDNENSANLRLNSKEIATKKINELTTEEFIQANHYSCNDEMNSSRLRDNSNDDDDKKNESNSMQTVNGNSPSLPLSKVKMRNHNTVQSVEEILNQQRFSRRLSAYSISEFLKDYSTENTDIDEIINSIGE